MDKRAFRKIVRARTAALDEDYLAASDAGIFENISSLPEFKAAPTVFAYMSVGREISTKAIIDLAVGVDKRICLPRSRDGGEMDFAEPVGGLIPGRFGIPEPDGALPAVEPAPGDMIIVPALCCAPDGRRQGRGGGYYDRFLAAHPDVVSVCPAREKLLCEDVPVEWNDLRPDYVITETRIIKCGRAAAVDSDACRGCQLPGADCTLPGL